MLVRSICLPAGTKHVLFGELAHLIADALWPDAGPNDDHLRYAVAQTKLVAELNHAAQSGVLPVKDPISFGPHSFPMGDALNRALVRVEDLRAYVVDRGLSVLLQFSVDEDGGLTSFLTTQEAFDTYTAEKKTQRDERHKQGHYTMYEAAEVLATANAIGGAKAFLKNRMCPAFESGALRLTDPKDGGPVVGRACRPYDDWVTPEAIDEWLTGARFLFLWPVTESEPLAAPLEAARASDGVEPVLDTLVKPVKTHRDSITPVIELAQSKCREPNDTAEVWAQMGVLAENETPPFLASTERGLKYSMKNQTKHLTRDALDKRLHPEKRGAPGKRR